jgi:hypothetical protein
MLLDFDPEITAIASQPFWLFTPAIVPPLCAMRLPHRR